jgi:hypothetical protein
VLAVIVSRWTEPTFEHLAQMDLFFVAMALYPPVCWSGPIAGGAVWALGVGELAAGQPISWGPFQPVPAAGVGGDAVRIYELAQTASSQRLSSALSSWTDSSAASCSPWRW